MELIIITLFVFSLMLLIMYLGANTKNRRVEKENYKIKEQNECLVIENDNLKDLLNIKTN